jgi:DNA-binding NarL/FixJ family response regulator
VQEYDRMELLVRTNLLAVGLNGRAQQLDELPIRLVVAGSASQAVGCIRNDRFESVLSTWNLEDMPAGLFLKRLRVIKPDMKIIVLVDGRNPSEEILARSIGVCAVLADDCSDGLLVQTVASVLGLDVPTAAITEAVQSTDSKNNYRRIISRLRNGKR